MGHVQQASGEETARPCRPNAFMYPASALVTEPQPPCPFLAWWQPSANGPLYSTARCVAWLGEFRAVHEARGCCDIANNARFVPRVHESEYMSHLRRQVYSSSTPLLHGHATKVKVTGNFQARKTGVRRHTATFSRFRDSFSPLSFCGVKRKKTCARVLHL